MLGWQRGLARVGIHTPFGRDAAGAAVLGLVEVGLNVVAFTVAEPDLRPPLAAFALQVPFVGVAAGAIAWRRRTPRAVLAVVVVAAVAGAMVHAEASVGGPFFSPLIAAYTVGACCRRRTAVTAVGATAALMSVATLTMIAAPALPFGAQPNAARLVFGTVMSILALAVAAVAGAGVVRQREKRARQAVVAERGRIARELHDVAAHHLSSMVVQAGAAEHQMTNDPEQARQVLHTIREQGSATLAQMRQIVGALREDDGDGAAPPTLRHAPQLVDEARDAGCQVTFIVEGRRPDPLPPAVDFAGYRVLQESLTNARRHAPGAAVLASVAYHDDAVEVEVTNEAAPDTPPPSEPTGGHGVTGMRERVALAGGELTAAPNPKGGWRVHAVLPTHDEREPSSAPQRHEPTSREREGAIR